VLDCHCISFFSIWSLTPTVILTKSWL